MVKPTTIISISYGFIISVTDSNAAINGHARSTRLRSRSLLKRRADEESMLYENDPNTSNFNDFERYRSEQLLRPDKVGLVDDRVAVRPADSFDMSTFCVEILNHGKSTEEIAITHTHRNLQVVGLMIAFVFVVSFTIFVLTSLSAAPIATKQPTTSPSGAATVSPAPSGITLSPAPSRSPSVSPTSSPTDLSVLRPLGNLLDGFGNTFRYVLFGASLISIISVLAAIVIWFGVGLFFVLWMV